VRAALSILAILLAGCVEPPGLSPALAPSLPPQLFLSSLMTLDARPDGEAAAVRAAPFFQAWQAGTDYPTWVADPPASDMRVTSLDVTLFVRATGPVAQSGRFPDIMVYAGNGPSWIGFGSRSDYDAFVPGRTYEIAVPVALPAGGLWISPDAPLGIKVVPVMMQQDQADIEILVGGPEASRVDATAQPLAVARGAQTRGSGEGEVTGTIYAGAAAPATTSARVPIRIPANATYVLAWMNTTSNQGVPDLDLGIEAPNGTALATSGTPTPREALRLSAANLVGEGDYRLVVTTAGSPHATWRVEWTIGTS
jgi:hypothetical protein